MEKIYLCKTMDVQEGKILSRITPYGLIAITKIKDTYIAFHDACPHDGAPFEKATINIADEELVCPRHGARFHLLTGKVRRMPATEDLELYRVITEGDAIYIEIE